jgi:alkylhydroperoxidase/carboxymuconolactone decarboxylase family protein YurZ
MPYLAPIRPSQMQIVNTMSGMMVLHAPGARRHITAALDLGATPQEIIEATPNSR